MSELTEAAWQAAVVDLAETCGYRCCHTYKGRVANGAWRTNTTVKGWPDETFFKPGDFLMAEVKTDRGVLSPEQEVVIAELRAAGVDVYVWRPRDFWDVVDRLQRGVE